MVDNEDFNSSHDEFVRGLERMTQRAEQARREAQAREEVRQRTEGSTLTAQTRRNLEEAQRNTVFGRLMRDDNTRRSYGRVKKCQCNGCQMGRGCVEDRDMPEPVPPPRLAPEHVWHTGNSTENTTGVTWVSTPRGRTVGFARHDGHGAFTVELTNDEEEGDND